MPPYDWLLRKEVNLSDLPSKMRVLSNMNVPYSAQDLANPIALAETQAQQIANEVASQGGPSDLADKEIIALVAYLQRLGTDIKASSAD